MLDVIVDAVVDILGRAGLQAVREYPRTLLDPEQGPVVCVGVKSSKLLSAGAGEYLGLRETAEGGVTELYGLRLELVLTLSIFSPCDEQNGAAGCARCFTQVSDALGELPSGLRSRALVCGVTQPDSLTEMFRCDCELHCAAYLTAEADEETGEFTDFVLKGVLKT